jgi:hypothetical protein
MRVDASLRSDGINNFDFALFKRTGITERAGIEFRFEFFNLLNDTVRLEIQVLICAISQTKGRREELWAAKNYNANQRRARQIAAACLSGAKIGELSKAIKAYSHSPTFISCKCSSCQRSDRSTTDGLLLPVLPIQTLSTGATDFLRVTCALKQAKTRHQLSINYL